MQVIRQSEKVPQHLLHGVIAIGNFDGMHVGHRLIVQTARDQAMQQDKPCLAMTFTPHPKHYFSHHDKPLAIEPLHQRLRHMQALSLDGVVLMRFDAALATMAATGFIEHILHKWLNVSHVVVGKDFCFGEKRQGDVALLEEHGRHLNIAVTSAEPYTSTHTGYAVSSSQIREALASGNMQDAAALLGRPYAVYGRVQRGHQRGRNIGSATMNIPLNHLHCPRYGVYAVRYRLGQAALWVEGIANLGISPTFGDVSRPVLEVHSLTPCEDAYGQRINVQLLHHIRDEQRFSNVAVLQQHIAQDIAHVKAWFQRQAD